MNAGRLTTASLLLIDDEEANLDLLEDLLMADGYRRITRVSDPRRAMSVFEACAPDLILLDLHMPYMTGYEVLEVIRERVEPGDYLPVLVLTADITTEARDRALSRGARDFLTKPFDAVEVLLRVRNLLETRLLHRAQLEARLRAEASERHATLLAEASRLLSSALDSETGLSQLTRLLVPGFAGSLAFLVVGDGEYRIAAGSGRGEAADRLPGGLDPAADPLAQALASGESRRLTTAEAEVFVAPLHSSAKAVGAMLATPPNGAVRFGEADGEMLVDLASRTALALENARLFADAQRASQARERMLSVVAHDLRNPLAVVAMYAEMLLDLLPSDPEADAGGDSYAADALTSIYKSALHMQEQIETLLDISRLQQGTFSVKPAVCAVAALFAEADLLLRPLAAARKITLTVHGDGNAEDVQARLDAARVQQVLSNLVGNAIKFSPEGGSVAIRWTTSAGELRVAVSDSGPGIASDQIPHLFGAFWQAERGDRRGVGLGLWIARAIVQGHGGRIWVDTAEGGGATFHFVIPLGGERTMAADPPASEMGRITHDPVQLIP
jgi:signal transduction histidine kinase/CheY-like chemotaxis protein